MQNLKISVSTIFVLLLIFTLHFIGMSENLYIKFWFYDIIMHILGGIGIAMSVYCVLVFLKLDNHKGRFWSIVTLTFLAGFAWELFEIYFNLTGSKLWSTPYYLDTIKDLFNDVLGSVIVGLVLKNK